MKKELVPGYQLPGIPDLFHEAFSDCEQHHQALKEEKKLPGREQLTWIAIRGFVPWNPRRAPTVLTAGPSNSVNPIPVKLHCQVISTLILLTMHAASIFENVARQ